ncbi:MFS transporter [Polaribacter cellanae]|uniref:MFS transporter n=1 Tax=Polaribacter cellanae TaxID=2818493 RepID=A0A975CPN3_9FLAO|nr:MFS transporter [Polaribacter cellanae]QTE22400.1 MFS transporter [Polaribacter cellanae]
MSNSPQNHPPVKKDSKIPFLQLAAYGFGGIIPIALFNIAGQLMGLIGNISMGLSALWLGVILIIPRLWDAISDPIVGHFSDNIRTPWGRRRPFLLIGGIAVAISFVLMWWIPDGKLVHEWFSTEESFQWFQLGYILFWLLIFFTACTIFEIPHGALGMEMSTDYHERTRLFSAKSFLGNLFAMSTPWLFALANMEYFKGADGNEADGMKYVSMLVAVILIPLSFWWFFTVKEPGFKKVKKQKKTPFWKDIKHTFKNKTFIRLVAIVFTLAMGFNFVNLLGYYIPIYYIFDGNKEVASTLLGINGTIWAITGLLAVFPLNWLSPKVGKRKTLLIAIGLMFLAQLSKIVCYNHEFPYLIIIPTILLSVGMLFFFTLGSSMVGDICDEDYLKTNRKSEGSYYSIFWWFIKMGTALASFVAGLLIVFTQFDETQVIKVDDFKGSINKIEKNIAFVKESQKLTFVKYQENLNTLYKENIADVNDYLITLNNLKTKIAENTEATEAEKNFKKDLYLTATKNIKKIKNTLEKEHSILDYKEATSKFKMVANKNISSFSKIELTRAKLNGALLLDHLKKEATTNKNSTEHYKNLVTNLSEINHQLKDLQTTNLDEFFTAIKDIKLQVMPLNQQSPYTLLMMRAVEIGLPLILCVISFLFTLRYPLTEKRSFEIKAAIEKREQEQEQEQEEINI